MNIALLIPDGVGVRNFVLGPFLRQASETAEVHALHKIPEDILPTYSGPLNGRVKWRSLSDYRDNALTLVLRKSLSNAHLYWVDTGAMRIERSRPVKGPLRSRLPIYATRLIGRVAASSRGIRTLDRWHSLAAGRLPEVERYRRLFGEIKPSVLFSSHQRPLEVLPPVLAAKSLGIPTATFVFSWDNLTSKGRIAAPFEHYLVWSELMREELLRYYPDVSPQRVHIVGTPQFDPYMDHSLIWPREEFFGRIGADPSRPLICYSGGDIHTCPEDQEHVRVLLDLIRAGHIKGSPQVLLRPAPVDNGSRYDQVRELYPELTYAPPAWVHSRPGEWSGSLPLPEDVRFLANLTHYADLNINLASTMTLDFAIHDKPVVNVAFNVVSPPPQGAPLWEYINRFDHYRPVLELGAARPARSPEELAGHANAYLADPSLDREGRRRFVELEVSKPMVQSSPRIVEALERIVNLEREFRP